MRGPWSGNADPLFTICKHFCVKTRPNIVMLVEQGDVYDSSDEEWDEHIGRHTIAFLGLNEPVDEIALDEGVGIGRMVRNAFAHADDIHIRATGAATSSNGDPGESSDTHMSDPERHHNMNERENEVYIAASPEYNLRGSARRLGVHSPNTAKLDRNSSTSGDSDNQDASGDGEGEAHTPTNSGADCSSSEQSGDPKEDAPGSSTDQEWDASNATSSGEDVEDLMGSIPTDGTRSSPEIDIAATLPLYEGSTLSMLCATLLIVNCCKTHSVSNMFLNELLMLLSMSIFPKGNCLPKTEYEASKILRRLGLAYNMIHACPNGFCLFRGEREDAVQCPVGDHDRYRMCGRSRVTALILRHFPLIPQLQRMFSSKKLSKLNMWHHFHKSEDGKMRHTADSPEWKFVHTELEPKAGDNMFRRDP